MISPTLSTWHPPRCQHAIPHAVNMAPLTLSEWHPSRCQNGIPHAVNMPSLTLSTCHPSRCQHAIPHAVNMPSPTLSTWHPLRCQNGIPHVVNMQTPPPNSILKHFHQLIFPYIFQTTCSHLALQLLTPSCSAIDMLLFKPPLYGIRWKEVRMLCHRDVYTYAFVVKCHLCHGDVIVSVYGANQTQSLLLSITIIVLSSLTCYYCHDTIVIVTISLSQYCSYISHGIITMVPSLLSRYYYHGTIVTITVLLPWYHRYYHGIIATDEDNSRTVQTACR